MIPTQRGALLFKKFEACPIFVEWNCILYVCGISKWNSTASERANLLIVLKFSANFCAYFLKISTIIFNQINGRDYIPTDRKKILKS